MSAQEKQGAETAGSPSADSPAADSPDADLIPGDPQGFVPTSDFGRELLAIRRMAIANGLKELSFNEAMAELEKMRRD
ncbi:MAG: hypothetical protein LBK52_07795 [Deltaproteobacteria bacterium]|jgi:hypothetical protein|nr:hypothetical protein [Deltaproteobacteria bacterium]